MSKFRSLMLPVALGVSAINGEAEGQPGLTGVILHGASTRPGSAPPGTPTILTPGVRVESPRTSWTEIAFTDGSSVVLDPGADFTLQGIEKDPESGHLVIRAASGRGRLRIETSDGVEVLLTTPGARVRVVAATVVVTAGRGGSATLISGRRLVVQRGGEEDVVRRPGFVVVFDNGMRHETRSKLAEAIDAFAPVMMGGANFAGVEVASATTSTGAANASLPTGLNANQGLGVPAPTPGTSSGTNTSAGGTSAGGAGTGTEGISGGAGTGGASGTGTSPSPAAPRAAQNFSLVVGSLPSSIGAAPGSTIAAPGANSVTSSIDGFGNFLSGFSAAGATTNVDFTPLGTARVRRFIPDSSGFSTPRNDTGVVSVPGGDTGVANSFFQQLTKNTLDASGATTFYDAVAKVGTLVLTTATTTGKFDTSGRELFNQVTIPRISVTDTAPSVTDPGQNMQRPFLFLVSDGPGSPLIAKKYFGSAVFENGLLNNTPTDGKVTALSGDTGAIMFIAAPGNPYSFPSRQSSVGPVNLCPPSPCLTGTYNTTVGAPVQPGVFIVDKIHTTTGPSTDNSDTRGIELGERFFVIGGTPLPLAPTGLPGAPPGTVTRFAISDGLNPLGGFVQGKTIEDQFIAPGSSQQPAAFNQYNAFRPETFVAGVPRGDTHLYVISGAMGRNPAMRADLQIAADGRSSASASVGGIGTLPNGSLALSGATVGSAQLATNASATSITANLGSLGTDSTGTGAHMFGGSNKARGQIGYFAVGQADVRLGAPGTPAGDQPGTLQAVGQPGNTSPFAFTRLATNVGAPSTLPAPGQLNSQGFATGVVQSFTNGQGSLYALSSKQLGDVTIISSPPNTEFTAELSMSPTSVGELSSDPLAAPAPGGVTGATMVLFGGSQATPPTTALTSPATFAAVAPGMAMASVDNDLLAGIQNRQGSISHPVTSASVDASLPASNEHLAWGYFLGDLAVQASGAIQDHAHLGFWVAGQPVSIDMLRTLTGTATYGGGMVGTAVEPGRIATVVGQFAQQWNFANRTGTLNASFDSASWNSLGLSMPGGTNVFTGAGNSSNIADRSLAVQGSFFHNGTPTSANLPAAVGGLFAIHNSTGTYGANGVLVGARR